RDPRGPDGAGHRPAHHRSLLRSDPHRQDRSLERPDGDVRARALLQGDLRRGPRDGGQRGRHGGRGRRQRSGRPRGGSRRPNRPRLHRRRRLPGASGRRPTSGRRRPGGAVSQRKKFVAGNWKMHTTLAEGRELARAIRAEVENVEGVRIAVIPPFTSVAAVAEVLRGSRIEVGGQDLHWEEKGAFTGEVSAPMLRDAGATVVLAGHSERRQYFGETDELANRKVRAALAAGLSPVPCGGATLDERDAGRTLDGVGRPVR